MTDIGVGTEQVAPDGTPAHGEKETVPSKVETSWSLKSAVWPAVMVSWKLWPVSEASGEMVNDSGCVMPERAMVCGELGALSATRIWAKREPGADGVKATVMVQPWYWG